METLVVPGVGGLIPELRDNATTFPPRTATWGAMVLRYPMCRSTGSSSETMLRPGCSRAMCRSMAASVVLLPLPAGPVSSSTPWLPAAIWRRAPLASYS